MTPSKIKFYFRSNPSLLRWILTQEKAQHIKMRYEIEDEVKKGLRNKAIDKAELSLLTQLTSGETSKNYILKEL